MGLGLYIAQQIAIAHGGWIDVESSEADGTLFELHLPRSA
jgi:signal transduction histidine kinase